ncbi:hypothetical protein ACLI09_13290 [Flavobacterium sp. RHBU_24]|uniref:hypothetical protein n=1 Tax=Flavobacterium sp. RHBU_24 TaxID=3391185 RepID=UPI0039849ADA
MGGKNNKGILLIVLWLIAIPFAFANPPGDITDFKKVTPSVQYKREGSIEYCVLQHGQLSLQVAVHDDVCDFTCWAVIRFVNNGKPISEWVSEGMDDPEHYLQFYYSESAKSYYIVCEQYVEEWEAFNLYYVAANTVTDEGFFEADNEGANKFYIGSWLDSARITSVSRKGNTSQLAYVDRAGKELLKFNKYVSTEPLTEYDTYMDPVLKVKAPLFNWKDGFTPTLKYTKTFDIDKDNEPELYKIDWATHSVTYGDANAMEVLKTDYLKDNIRFKGDTLMVMVDLPGTWNTDIDSKTFYFTLSKKYNTAMLCKYRRYIYRSNAINNKGEMTVTCNFGEDYFSYDEERMESLETAFSIPEDYNFCHYCYGYGRRYTLNELYKHLAKKEEPNSFENLCSDLPDKREIEQLFVNEPLTAKNVQKYNDIAFYILELLPYNQEKKASLTDSAIFLLDNITKSFPDRTVAWLNLADAYWENDRGHWKTAKKHYSKYLALMQIQGKDMNKVPQRVYQRLKQ